MRKIYFLIGVITLSTNLVSCSSDDDFHKKFQENTKQKNKSRTIQSKLNDEFNKNNIHLESQPSQSSSSSNSYNQSPRGDDQIDKQNNNGK